MFKNFSNHPISMAKAYQSLDALALSVNRPWSPAPPPTAAATAQGFFPTTSRTAAAMWMEVWRVPWRRQRECLFHGQSENEMDDLGVHPFLEAHIYIYTYTYTYTYTYRYIYIYIYVSMITLCIYYVQLEGFCQTFCESSSRGLWGNPQFGCWIFSHNPKMWTTRSHEKSH